MLQATRAKVAPVNLIYGSHFSATEATYKISQNMGNFVEFTRTFTRITHKPVLEKAYLYLCRVYIFNVSPFHSNQLLFIFYMSHIEQWPSVAFLGLDFAGNSRKFLTSKNKYVFLC